jgi:hypothetical protein
MPMWDDKAKRLLKSEMIRRGVSNSDLVGLLNEIGVVETKASIDSKISRGSFVIGCNKLELETYESPFLMVAEPDLLYKTSKK